MRKHENPCYGEFISNRATYWMFMFTRMCTALNTVLTFVLFSGYFYFWGWESRARSRDIVVEREDREEDTWSRTDREEDTGLLITPTFC